LGIGIPPTLDFLLRIEKRKILALSFGHETRVFSRSFKDFPV
jgi:hypothetical protein